MIPEIFLLTVDKKGKPIIIPYPIKVPRKAIDEMIHSKKKGKMGW